MAFDLLTSTRALTVVGPGGAGKTRFALELATRAREERFSDFRDGVFWVPLAALRDSALVLDSVAKVVGASAISPRPSAKRGGCSCSTNLEQVLTQRRSCPNS